MSTIERLFTTTMTHKRLVSVNNRESWTVIGTLDIQLQPSDPTRAESNLGIYKTHSGWTYVTADVRDGDVLVLNDENYKVKGLSKHEIGTNPHIQLSLERSAGGLNVNL